MKSIKRKGAIAGLAAVSVLWAAGSLTAGPDLMKSHSGKTCNYCHVSPAKYPKQKNAGYKKGQAKHRLLAQDKNCSGSGCHK